MSKIFSIIESLLLTVTFVVPPINNDNINWLINKNFIDTIDNSNLYNVDFNYYPFIYCESNEWVNENILNNNVKKLLDGFLYLFDLENNDIYQLSNDRIDIFREDNFGFYFIYNNKVLRYDYDDESLKVIYSSKNKLDNHILEYDYNNLIFIDDEYICIFDLAKNYITKIKENNHVLSINIHSNGFFSYELDRCFILYDIENQTYSEYENYYDIDNLFNDSLIESIVPTDINMLDIITNYPDGSYFSTTGNECTCHGLNGHNCSYHGNCDCIVYDYSIQCVAFAKWASDQYAHKSSWSPTSSEKHYPNIIFDSNSTIQLFFSTLHKGTYIRIADSNGNGFHSILFLELLSTGIKTYEANVDGHNCLVKNKTRSNNYIRNYFPSVSSYVSHNFLNNCVSYNSTYHIQYCDSNGCSAWRYEKHFTLSPGNTTVCEGCGYVGNISNNERAK